MLPVRYFSRHRRLILLLCAILAAAGTDAQISITASDVEAAYTPGTILTSYLAHGPLSITVGPASASAQVWDLRTVPFAEAGRLEPVTAQTAPSVPEFSAANYFLRETVDNLGPLLVMYTYHTLSSADYCLLGTADDSAGIVMRYRPPAKQMKFPFAMGSSWVHEALPETTEVMPGMAIITQTTTTHNVDAFGTLRLPAGDFEVLRDRVVTVTESTTPVGTSQNRMTTYNFVSRQMGGLQVMVDSTQDGLETVTVEGGVSAVAPGSATGAAEVRPSGRDDFWLAQNYPNPFNPSTTIRFSLPAPEAVTLTVFDGLGREVQRLVEGRLGAGVHTSRWVPGNIASGAYYCRLEAGNRILCRPLLFIR